MKKKNWSFILAFVLSVGLGLGSIALADPYAAESAATEAQLAAQTGNTGVFTVTPTPEQQGQIGDTESRICTVFNYRSGVLVSVMDQDRNVTIYDSGRPRATLGYNDDGTFTMTGFYLYGSDADDIAAMPGATDAEKLKNFLIAAGVDPSALKKSGTDSDGNVDTSVQEDVEWLAVAAAKLKEGINYSISVNLTATYGASMTWSVNGKAQQTISYDGTVIEQYHYNALGTLESISQTTYTANTSSGTATTTYTKSTNTVYLDAYGRQSYVTNSSGTVTTTFAYYGNGSTLSSHSTETNETTYFSNGKASYVLNDQGFKTAQYDYHTNGSLNGIKSFNYDADSSSANVTSTTITAYKWGRVVGSADLSSGSGVQNYDQLRTAIAEIKANPDAALASIRAGASSTPNSSIYSNITSIALYKSDLNNAALMNFLGITAADKAKMLAMSNGYSSVGSAALVFGSISPGTTTTSVYAPDGTTIDGTFYEHGDSVMIEAGTPGINLTINITVNDRGGASYQLNATKVYTIKEAVSNLVAVIDPAVEGTLFPPEGATEEQIIAMAQQLGININDPEAMANLRKGFYTDSETGKTYAIVNAESVNIMDGTGFQAADGEVILVEVDETTKNNIIASGDKKVLFMGNIRPDVNGFMTMAMDVSYSGGYKTGNDIQATHDAIQNEQLDWVTANTYGGSYVDVNGIVQTVAVEDSNSQRLSGYLGDWSAGLSYLAQF